MTDPKEAKLNDRVALHASAIDTSKKAYIKVDDDVYKDRFDFEEVAVERLSNRLQKRYRVTSIPFITYGINKGDTVVVDGKSVVAKVLVDDGQYGYRIAFPKFTSSEQAHQSIETVLKYLNDKQFDTEYFNHKISAVNTVNSNEAVRLEGLLVELTSQKK